MRGTFDKAGQNQDIQLYVSLTGKGANSMIVVSASDSTGTILKSHRLEQPHAESFLGQMYFKEQHVIAVDLPRNFLEERKAKGLDIQLKGYHNESLIVQVPPDYLSNYLSNFDTAVAQNKKVTNLQYYWSETTA
jgi:hypothetical protein